MFRSHIAIIFCVGYPFRPINLVWSPTPTTQGICVPSIAHMTFLKKGQYRGSLWIFAWLSRNKWSLGFIYSMDRLKQAINTSWKRLFTISLECLNLSWIILLLTPCPITSKNIATISSTPMQLVGFKPWSTKLVQSLWKICFPFETSHGNEWDSLAILLSPMHALLAH